MCFNGQGLEVDQLIYCSVHVSISITQGRLKFWGRGFKFQALCFKKYLNFATKHLMRLRQKHAFYLEEVKKLFRTTEVEVTDNIETVSVYNSDVYSLSQGRLKF